jgi:hypothetical protein
MMGARSQGRKTLTRPLSFLTTFQRQAQLRQSNSSDIDNRIIVDTTIRTENPSFSALGVLGKVVKSIGDKLNVKINENSNSQVYFEIDGIHGNYVSATYIDAMEEEEAEIRDRYLHYVCEVFLNPNPNENTLSNYTSTYFS